MKQTVNITHAFLLEVSKHLPRKTEYTLVISKAGITISPSVFASNRQRVKRELMDHVVLEHLPAVMKQMKSFPLFAQIELEFKMTPGTWKFTRTGKKNRRWRCIYEATESLCIAEVIK